MRYTVTRQITLMANNHERIQIMAPSFFIAHNILPSKYHQNVFITSFRYSAHRHCCKTLKISF